MGLSWQEYWSRLPFPSLEDIPDPGIESTSPALQADSLSSEPFIYDGKLRGSLIVDTNLHDNKS